MEADEAAAVARWRAFLDAATGEILPARLGKLVKSTGDGVLAAFPDCTLAVAAAFDMHAAIAAPDRAGRPMRLRIGIHIADVYVDTLDVFGDGVNVAARLADLAGEGGGTILSAEARDQITSGLDAAIEDLGEQRLRNRNRAVHAFRAWPPSSDLSLVPPPLRTHGRPSIAVVPFRVLSAEPGHEFLGDGLAEETIAALSSIADFFVVSRLSSMAFRDRNPGVQRIGSILGVQYVLSGSLRASARRAVLLAELADARSGQVLWAERFEGDLLDLFAAQADLARSVAARAGSFVRSRELHHARLSSLDELDAFGLTLRGIERMHRPSRSDFSEARELLQEALQRDPTSAGTHAWLALWHLLRVVLGASDDPQHDAGQARVRSEAALDRDPENALALAVDSHVHAWLAGDLDAAERRVAQALGANGNEPIAWLFQAMVHAWRGRGPQAVQAAGQALSLSPLDPLRYYFLSLAGTAHVVAGDYVRAIELARESLRENQLHTPSLRTLAVACGLAGDREGARQAVTRLRALQPDFTVSAFKARYPGRGSPQAAAFASVLGEAGLPA